MAGHPPSPKGEGQQPGSRRPSNRSSDLAALSVPGEDAEPRITCAGSQPPPLSGSIFHLLAVCDDAEGHLSEQARQMLAWIAAIADDAERGRAFRRLAEYWHVTRETD